MRPGRRGKVDLLASVPLFAGLSKKELGEVALIADELDLPAGRAIVTEGERGREFFVLVEGTAVVTRKGTRLAEIEGGGWFGEIALVANVPRTATVTTSSSVRLLVINERAFGNLVGRMPSIAVKVLASVGERLATHEQEP